MMRLAMMTEVIKSERLAALYTLRRPDGSVTQSAVEQPDDVDISTLEWPEAALCFQLIWVETVEVQGKAYNNPTARTAPPVYLHPQTEILTLDEARRRFPAAPNAIEAVAQAGLSHIATYQRAIMPFDPTQMVVHGAAPTFMGPRLVQ